MTSLANSRVSLHGCKDAIEGYLGLDCSLAVKYILILKFEITSTLTRLA